jgi:hypothetical protein
MPSEPPNGVWLSAEQAVTLAQFIADPETGEYADQDGGLVTITDLRSERVYRNLPPEIAGELSDYRGSVLIEQETRGGGIDTTQRAAIIDRRGKPTPIRPERLLA